jgi:hypothetical protein
MSLVQEFNNPDAWEDYGGELARISYLNGHLVITTQQDSDEARAVVDEANAFVRTHEMFWRDGAPRPRGEGNTPVGFDELPDDAALLTKLRETRIDIDYQSVPMQDALADLSKRAGITIHVDAEALEMIGVEPDTPVTVTRPDIPAARAIDLVAAALGDGIDTPVWTVRNGRIEFTSDEAMREKTETVVYDVRDLLKSEATMLLDMGQPYIIAPDDWRFLAFIEESVDPDGWQDVGGDTGTALAVRQFLFVKNTTAAHREIQTLLAQMGGALGLPADEWWTREAARRQTTDHDPADLDVLKQAAEARLSAPLGQVTLADALRGITNQTDVPIIADWKALATIEIATPSDPVTQLVRGETVAAALEAIRHQVGDELGRPVIVARDGALLLTTDEAARQDRMTVVYDVRDLLADRLAGYDAAAYLDVLQELIDVLVENVDPDGWNILGGETGSINTFAGVLVIHNTPENHRGVEALLARLRAGRGLAVAPDVRARVDAQSRPRADDRIVRIHPVADLLAYSMTVDPDLTHEQALQTLVDFIHENVEPEHWMALGGDVGQLMAYDDLLVIRDTVDNHRAVQMMLAQLRSLVALPQPADADPLAAGVTDLGPAWLEAVASAVRAAGDEPQTLIESLFDVTNDPFVPEHGALLVAELAARDWLVEARLLAAALASAGEEYDIASAMSATLIDESLDDEERGLRMGSLDLLASERIHETVQAAILIIEREQRIARVLDERLWPLVTTDDAAGDGTLPKGVAMHSDGGVLVALLPTDVTKSTQDALHARGLSIESVTSSNVIVGSVLPARLAELALSESVRRVEPVEVE